jgi:negative regulator of replication initiation
MDAAIQQELQAMERCAQALGQLDPPAQIRVLTWLNESLCAKRSRLAAESNLSASPGIQVHLQSQAFRSLATAQEKFLSILDLLRRLHPNTTQFLDIACTITGRKRKYFAQTPEEVEECGTGAKAMRITRNYPLYVDCNNSTESKRQILRKLMEALGEYEEADIEAAASAIQ